MKITRNEEGFTLLEVILGILVLGIVGVAVISYWYSSTRALDDIHSRHIARELAKNSIELIKEEIGNLDTDSSFANKLNSLAIQETSVIKVDGAEFSREILVNNHNKSDLVKELNVKVSWDGKEIALTTLIADKRKRDYALSFDGRNDYLSIPHSKDLDITNAITVSFWFKSGGTPISDSMIPISKGDYKGAWWFEYYFDNKMRFFITYSDFIDRSAVLDIPDNAWHYITGVFDGNTQRIYLDGVLQSIQRINSGLKISKTKNSLTIAKSHDSRGWGRYYTKAKFKNVEVWNRPLNQTEIIDRMKLDKKTKEDGLVGYWKLNEGNTLIAYDYAGANNGIIYGAKYETIVWK